MRRELTYHPEPVESQRHQELWKVRSQKLRVDRGLDEVAHIPSSYGGLFVETLSQIIPGVEDTRHSREEKKGQMWVENGRIW